MWHPTSLHTSIPHIHALQVLKGMVGTSQKIYNQIVELCVVKYRDSETLYLGAKVRMWGPALARGGSLVGETLFLDEVEPSLCPVGLLLGDHPLCSPAAAHAPCPHVPYLQELSYCTLRVNTHMCCPDADHPLMLPHLQELSYCTLRAQLLMAIHDDSCSVASKDRCHELAWTLDAGIMNGRLSEKHLDKLEKYFIDVGGQSICVCVSNACWCIHAWRMRLGKKLGRITGLTAS